MDGIGSCLCRTRWVSDWQLLCGCSHVRDGSGNRIKTASVPFKMESLDNMRRSLVSGLFALFAGTTFLEAYLSGQVLPLQQLLPPAQRIVEFTADRQPVYKANETVMISGMKGLCTSLR